MKSQRQILKNLIFKYFYKYALFFKFILDNRHVFKEPQETPLGFKLIGNRSMEQGVFESQEFEIIKKLLDSTDNFINIGANIGYYCCLALSKGKYTLAFEPIAANLRYLYKNIKANHWENNCEVLPLALGDHTGIINIYGGGTGASLVKGWAGTPEEYHCLVPISTMDAVLGTRFTDLRCLVLVDVEGAEYKLLKGAEQFLQRKNKPVWMMEISTTEHQPKGIALNPNLKPTFETFWKNGYESWTVEKQARRVNENELEKLISTGKDTLSTHNFLFFEKGKKSEFIF